MKTFFETNYASIERDTDGTWEVFNDVTGLLIASQLPYKQAYARMIELTNHYRSIEFGHNQ